jgi:hypothetical protein
LNNELPYITDQSGLSPTFYLPIKNCLVYLGSNDGAPGITPQQLLPLIPAIAIPTVIIAVQGTNSNDTAISPEIIPGIPPYCDTPLYPVPCK